MDEVGGSAGVRESRRLPDGEEVLYDPPAPAPPAAPFGAPWLQQVGGGPAAWGPCIKAAVPIASFRILNSEFHVDAARQWRAMAERGFCNKEDQNGSEGPPTTPPNV